MGFFDSIVSFISPDAYAEEPAYQGSSGEVMGKDDTPAQKESNVKGGSERKPDEPEKTEHIKGEGDDEDKAEGASADEPEEEEAAEEEEPEEEEEEEEEEPEDPKPKIEAGEFATVSLFMGGVGDRVARWRGAIWRLVRPVLEFAAEQDGPC